MLEFYVQLDPVERLDVNMPRDMTYEEIASLGGAINRLNSADLDLVAHIIDQHVPAIDDDDNPDIEIDLQSLDNTTLWTLYDFVREKKMMEKLSAAAPPVPLSGPAATPPVPLSGDAAKAATAVFSIPDVLYMVVGNIRPAPLLLQQVSCISHDWRKAARRVIETALTDACGGGGPDGVSVAVVQRTPLLDVDKCRRARLSVPMARVTLPMSKCHEVIARLGRADLPEALKGIVLHKWRGAPEVMEEKRM